MLGPRRRRADEKTVGIQHSGGGGDRVTKRTVRPTNRTIPLSNVDFMLTANIRFYTYYLSCAKQRFRRKDKNLIKSFEIQSM